MKRFIEENLIKWKDEKGRKPLILSGARQVGKSYLIEKNFAPHFEQLLVINREPLNLEPPGAKRRQPDYRIILPSHKSRRKFL